MALPLGTSFVGIISRHLRDEGTSGNIVFTVYWVANQDVGDSRPNDSDAEVSLAIGATPTEATLQAALKAAVAQSIADTLDENVASIVLAGCGI